MRKDKKKQGVGERFWYFRTKNIKKWMFCPACNNGEMTFNKKSLLWVCKDCGYHFSEDEFWSFSAFWYCDECGTYLNNQKGFDSSASQHICCNCGYENDTTSDNIKGFCSDCGKMLPNKEEKICVDCRQIRREKAKQRLIEIGKAATGLAVVVGTTLLATQAGGEKSTNDFIPPAPEDDSDENDNEVYGLGNGSVPACRTCGSAMIIDGWPWYVCPVCGNRVRIVDGKETWENEIFGQGKKQHHSDYELADFCRGEDLTDD